VNTPPPDLASPAEPAVATRRHRLAAATARRRRLLLAGAAAALLAGVAAATSLPGGGPPPRREPVLDDFNRPDGLVTNEYAHWNPHAPQAVRSPVWDVTSGSLFVRDGAAWSGVPDDAAPTASSRNGTHSAVFRAVTRRADFGDLAFSFRLRVHGLLRTRTTKAHDWDGVSVLVRYQSEEHLYAVTVLRRDGVVTIKKKVPGGDANGGTYHTLARGSMRATLGVWREFRVVVHDRADGPVVIELRQGGSSLVARDAGAGGSAPIRRPGRIGIRGDNAEFEFDDVVVAAG
jgi:hypothetical protein